MTTQINETKTKTMDVVELAPSLDGDLPEFLKRETKTGVKDKDGEVVATIQEDTEVTVAPTIH